MARGTENREKRRQYGKPKIEEVKLVAGEAVLTGCKVASTAPGPSGSRCTTTSTKCRTQTGS